MEPPRGIDYAKRRVARPREVRLMILGCQPPALGDKDAYERFREYEAKHRKFIESGRAINAVLFADEMARSPASDLYSAMRHVVADRAISSTGGFVCVVSNRPEGFRYSVFSDMLFNWPEGESADFILDLNHQIDFGASGGCPSGRVRTA